MRYVVEEMRDKKNTSNETILIVEDDASIGSFLVEALKQETPYEAVLVPDGFQALKAVRHLKPCLFITDYRLPHMNGIELYDRMRSSKALENTPTIIMSAYLPFEEVKKRKLVGLNKPFDLDELLTTIEKVLQ